jgi:hypothetical protein
VVDLDWNSKKFIKQASEISKEVEHYIREILERKYYTEQAYRSCAGLLNLGRKYSHQRLTKAFRRVVIFSNYGYKTIGNILKNNYDTLPDVTTQQQKELPFHDNIRGAYGFLVKKSASFESVLQTQSRFQTRRKGDRVLDPGLLTDLVFIIKYKIHSINSGGVQKQSMTNYFLILHWLLFR